MKRRKIATIINAETGETFMPIFADDDDAIIVLPKLQMNLKLLWGIDSHLSYFDGEVCLEWDVANTFYTFTYRLGEKEAYFTGFSDGQKVTSKKYEKPSDFIEDSDRLMAERFGPAAVDRYEFYNEYYKGTKND